VLPDNIKTLFLTLKSYPPPVAAFAAMRLAAFGALGMAAFV